MEQSNVFYNQKGGLADTYKNKQIVDNVRSNVLTIYDGKVLNFDGRHIDAKKGLTAKIIADNWLVDLKGEALAYRGLGASGQTPTRDQQIELEEQYQSDQFRDMVTEALSQKKTVDNSFTPAWTTLHTKHGGLGAAGAADTLFQTAYELVRRINYLRFEARRSYYLPAFQAHNICNTETVSKFNFDGFTQPKLLEGQPHLGDEEKPDVVRPEFETYNVQLFADSFRWETTLREKSDSYMDINESIQRQVPGIFASMLNQRILPVFAAKTAETALKAWDTRNTAIGYFANDAGEAFETGEVKLETFDGPLVSLGNRHMIRLYMKNRQGINVTTPRSTAPADARTGTLADNPQVTYHIDNHVVDYFMLVKRDHYVKLLEGVKLDFAYRDEMTPGNMEGRVRFAYNNVVPMIQDAGLRYTGYSA